jgi:hypothetical protein
MSGRKAGTVGGCLRRLASGIEIRRTGWYCRCDASHIGRVRVYVGVRVMTGPSALTPNDLKS